MNNWRLVESLEAIILDDNYTVYLIPFVGCNKKSVHKSEIMKEIGILDGNDLTYKNIESNSFYLKLDEYLQAYIKCPDFIDPNKYYRVANFFEGSPGRIITQLTCEMGSFSCEFEAAFSDKYPGKVMLVSEGMSDYDECMDEMIRVMSCEMNKRTRKWIPGHRYDSPNETLYYLGEFKSHKSSEVMSDYLADVDMTSAHLVIDDIKGLNNISDVFKSRCFGDILNSKKCIRVLDKLPLMVDSGEKLNNDITTLNCMWNDMLDNSLRSEKTTVKQVLDILCYDTVETNDSHFTNISNNLIDEIKVKIVKVIEKCMMIYWDTKVPISSVLRDSVGAIGPDKTKAENINVILGCIGGEDYFNDINAYSSKYYPTLLKRIGIDLEELIGEVLDNYSPKDVVFKSLENYINYSDYFIYRDLSRTNITVNYLVGKGNIIDKIFSPYLAKELKKLINEAKSGNTQVVTKYMTVKGKYTKDSLRAIITLEDILKSYNNEVPENLTSDILNDRFKKVTIEFDLNSEIK